MFVRQAGGPSLLPTLYDWLLTLPLAMVAGAGLLLAMGSKINQDTPLLFLVLLLELSLATGIVMRRRLRFSGLPAVRR